MKLYYDETTHCIKIPECVIESYAARCEKGCMYVSIHTVRKTKADQAL